MSSSNKYSVLYWVFILLLRGKVFSVSRSMDRLDGERTDPAFALDPE